MSREWPYSGVTLIFNPAAIPPKTRKHLSFDPLIKQIRLRAEQLPDSRRGNDCTYAVADAVMSAIALFAMKDPSLLAFQERRNDANMKNIFRIPQVPSDTRMRELLDPLEPNSLRPMFNDVLRELQRGKALEAFDFLEGYNLLSLDGSGYYSSKKVHCEHCLQRTNIATLDEVTNAHAVLLVAFGRTQDAGAIAVGKVGDAAHGNHDVEERHLLVVLQHLRIRCLAHNADLLTVGADEAGDDDGHHRITDELGQSLFDVTRKRARILA